MGNHEIQFVLLIGDGYYNVFYTVTVVWWFYCCTIASYYVQIWDGISTLPGKTHCAAERWKNASDQIIFRKKKSH